MASPEHLSLLDKIITEYETPVDQKKLELQKLGALPKPITRPKKPWEGPPAEPLTLKKVGSDLHQGFSDMMGAPQAGLEQASTNLTGEPLSAWTEKFIKAQPQMQIQGITEAILAKTDPKTAEIVNAMQDEAIKVAAKMGTDPMMYLMPASKIISGYFAASGVEGAATGLGEALAEHDKSGGVTPEMARAAVRSVASGAMAGLAGSHATKGLGAGVKSPEITFGEGKQSFDSVKSQALGKVKEVVDPLIPAVTKKRVKDLPTTQNTDAYLDALNNEDISKPAGYEAGEYSDSKYTIPGKPDSRWKVVQNKGDNKPNLDLDKSLAEYEAEKAKSKLAPPAQANMGLDPNQLKDAFKSVVDRLKSPKSTPEGTNRFDTSKSQALASDLSKPSSGVPQRGTLGTTFEPPPEMTKPTQLAPTDKPVERTVQNENENSVKLPPPMMLKKLAAKEGITVEELTARLKSMAPPQVGQAAAQAKPIGFLDLSEKLKGAGKLPTSPKAPKSGGTTDMLGLQQTWEKGKELIQSLKKKGNLLIPIPAPPEPKSKVPLIKSETALKHTDLTKATDRNALMDSDITNKYYHDSNYYKNDPKEFYNDPEVAPYMDKLRQVDNSLTQHSLGLNGFGDKDLVNSIPDSVWRTRANVDHEWYYNRVNALADEWKNSSTSEGAIILKEVIRSITGAKTPPYNPNKVTPTKAALRVYTPIVERMYRETQEALHNNDIQIAVSELEVNPNFSKQRTVFPNSDPEYLDSALNRDYKDRYRDKTRITIPKDKKTIRLYRGVNESSYAKSYPDITWDANGQAVVKNKDYAPDKYDVNSTFAKKGTLESWTSYEPVTDNFGGTKNPKRQDGYTYVEDIPKSRILTFFKSPNWRQRPGGIGENEFEFIVLSEEPKAGRLAKQERKTKIATRPDAYKEVEAKQEVERTPLSDKINWQPDGTAWDHTTGAKAGQVGMSPNGKIAYAHSAHSKKSKEFGSKAEAQEWVENEFLNNELYKDLTKSEPAKTKTIPKYHPEDINWEVDSWGVTIGKDKNGTEVGTIDSHLDGSFEAWSDSAQKMQDGFKSKKAAKEWLISQATKFNSIKAPPEPPASIIFHEPLEDFFAKAKKDPLFKWDQASGDSYTVSYTGKSNKDIYIGQMIQQKGKFPGYQAAASSQHSSGLAKTFKTPEEAKFWLENEFAEHHKIYI